MTRAILSRVRLRFGFVVATVMGVMGCGETTAPTPAPATIWVMGYYPSWGNYPISAIDWDALTHVATAFYLPDGKGGWAPGTFDSSTATMLIAAAHDHGKKVIASIGGTDSGAMFEASTKDAMAPFVASVEALVAMGYDGVDLDWEGGNLTTAEDHALEQSLIEELRRESPTIIITLTAAYENENNPDDLSWYGAIAGEVDRIELMTYGMAGPWQGWKSWHSAPLHWNGGAATPDGIDVSVAHYVAAKVPAAKLSVGTGFFGECYTTPVTAPSQELGQSGHATTLTYTNIMSSLYSPEAYHYDSEADAPYLAPRANGAQCTYVTYEDATSIAAKGSWVRSQGLGGTIVWTISDAFVPSGATVQEQNPLLEVVKASFLE